MKKILLHSIWLMAVCFGSASLLSCQKARLVEEWPDRADLGVNGRNGQAEHSDSTKVTPEFDINGWKGSIDVNFGFGGKLNGKLLNLLLYDNSRTIQTT